MSPTTAKMGNSYDQDDNEAKIDKKIKTLEKHVEIAEKEATITELENKKKRLEEAGHHNPSKRKASSQRLGFGNNDRAGADLACKPSKSHTNLPQGLGSLGKEGFKAFLHYFKQTALQIMIRVTSALAFGIRRDTGPPSCHRGPNWAAWLTKTTKTTKTPARPPG